MAITFDCFGTLVDADRPNEPWTAIADALAERNVRVPDGWEARYRHSHHEFAPGEEGSLVEHTVAALADGGVDSDPDVIHQALLAAFDGPVTVADGAADALEAATQRGSVGILSNCSLPGLVESTLARANLPVEFDAVVTSVGCGWRKPHDGAFHAAADALHTETEMLVHVGDDPRTDGGGRTCGVTVLLVDSGDLVTIPAELEGLQCG